MSQSTTWQRWKELQDFSRILEILEGPRILWIHRPILLHERSNNGAVCLCGCNSRRAVAREPIPHIDLLVSTLSGTRILQRPTDTPEQKAEFAELAKRARKVYAPIRCYAKQLRFILDDRHKVVVFFGGSRGGKSTAAAEWLFDGILIQGGPGAQFWWVSETREKSHIGLRKLVQGERTDRYVSPLIPPGLVVSFPASPRATDQRVILVDGSILHLKYARSPTGGNLKGDPAVRIATDELCEIDHAANFHTCLDRLTDSGGQFGGATTPVAGHWAFEEIHKPGRTYEEADAAEAEGKTVDIIAETVTAFDNPWIAAEEIERRIRTGGGKDYPQVQRDVFGQWVGDGDKLWSHFRARPDPETRICHLRSGHERDVSGWGLDNVTSIAARSVFPDVSKPIELVAGQDFNLWPMSVVVCQVGVPHGLDQSDPRNWILFVLDEVVKKGTVYDFAKFLATEAGSYRKLDRNYYAGLHIVCDSTGAQHNPPVAHGLTDKSSTLAKAMRDHGFDCQPCHWSRPKSGGRPSPVNPGKIDNVSLLHKLMLETVTDRNGQVWPRLVVHADRCPKLIDALLHQESDGKGRPSKVPGTASDRLSGPVDALLYLSWGLFAGSDAYERGTTQVVGW